jgi:hypothetical protein
LAAGKRSGEKKQGNLLTGKTSSAATRKNGVTKIDVGW